jgi:hypothetical protein
VIQTYKIDVTDDQGHIEEFSHTSEKEDLIRKQLNGFRRGAKYTFSVHVDVPNHQLSPPVTAVIRKCCSCVLILSCECPFN